MSESCTTTSTTWHPHWCNQMSCTEQPEGIQHRSGETHLVTLDQDIIITLTKVDEISFPPEQRADTTYLTIDSENKVYDCTDFDGRITLIPEEAKQLALALLAQYFAATSRGR